MQIIGSILIILAVIFFFVARGQKARAGQLAGTDTYDAATLHKLHERIAGSVGADALAEQCEVAGIVEADTPLQGKLSGKAVVWYTATVTREYEEQVTRRNAEGKTETTVERGSETVESHSDKILFYVRDASGRVHVDPDGAAIDLIETHNSLTQPEEKRVGKRRTTGIRSIERALPVGTQVFVHGCAVDRGGAVIIARNPRQRGEKFIVSRRSERELLRSASDTARNLLIAAGACGGIGALLAIWGFLI